MSTQPVLIPYRNQQLSNFIEDVNTRVSRAMESLLNPAQLNGMQSLIVKVQMQNLGCGRLLAEEIADYWGIIAEDQLLELFIMRMVRDAFLGLEDSQLDEICRYFDRALTLNEENASQSEDAAAKFESSGRVEELLRGNMWYVLLLIIQQGPLTMFFDKATLDRMGTAGPKIVGANATDMP